MGGIEVASTARDRDALSFRAANLVSALATLQSSVGNDDDATLRDVRKLLFSDTVQLFLAVSAPQKGRSKSKGGIPLDELLAAHASGRPVRATKTTPVGRRQPPKRRKRGQRKTQDGVCRAGMKPRSSRTRRRGWWDTRGSRRTTRRRRCKPTRWHPSGRLLYHVLGAVAEFARELIKERTVAGMKAAKKRGTHVGRPQALVGSRLAEAGRMLAAGKSQIETARILRVSRATIQRAYPGGSGRR